MDSDYEEWDRIYRRYPLEDLPWELGRPRKVLVELVEKGLIKRGKALDICCGAGTNALYLAKKGFQVQFKVGFFYESPTGHIIDAKDVTVQSLSFDGREDIFLRHSYLPLSHCYHLHELSLLNSLQKAFTFLTV